jgi:hypothetical protein
MSPSEEAGTREDIGAVGVKVARPGVAVGGAVAADAVEVAAGLAI